MHGGVQLSGILQGNQGAHPGLLQLARAKRLGAAGALPVPRRVRRRPPGQLGAGRLGTKPPPAQPFKACTRADLAWPNAIGAPGARIPFKGRVKGCGYAMGIVFGRWGSSPRGAGPRRRADVAANVPAARHGCVVLSACGPPGRLGSGAAGGLSQRRHLQGGAHHHHPTGAGSR
jgi:hypothetical protein